FPLKLTEFLKKRTAFWGKTHCVFRRDAPRTGRRHTVTLAGHAQKFGRGQEQSAVFFLLFPLLSFRFAIYY
ncbi:MAG: hypothetical protein J1E32_08230, partial [Treponema sp.]|nr:hypothetical protein [Treponema sp.]